LDPPDLWESQEHFPYIAFCSSCGVGLAVDYRSYHSDEPATYRCRSCLNKGGEGRFDEDKEFLTAFYREVIEGADLDDYTWPGRSGKEPLEEVAAFDPRRYVGYLVADGNSMGEVFGRCTSPSQMRFLSSKLEAVIRRALAEPTRLLMQNNPAEDRGNFIPVLPLILGGDDVFVLLPAPWALDFARRFCQGYEAEMEGVLREKGLDRGPRPTVSAAVVIVKSTHPYYRAHEVGENGVKQAKRLAKQIVIETRRAVSTVAFEVVLSGGLDQNRSYSRGVFRPTLQPYLAADGLKEAWGLSADLLLEARWRLRSAPGKRLAELKRLYDLAGLPASSSAEEMERWQKRLKRLLDRMRKSDSSLADGVQEALESLGDTKYPYWLTVVRPDEEPWKGHGLPDLLATWDFSLLVDQPRARYETEVG
jgi:CRISPR/Cas system-associated protein Cas10 (large subunit of type III CRISPR-Cas system)